MKQKYCHFDSMFVSKLPPFLLLPITSTEIWTTQKESGKELELMDKDLEDYTNKCFVIKLESGYLAIHCVVAHILSLCFLPAKESVRQIERFPLFLPSYETPSSEKKNYESFLPLPLKERNWNWLYKNIYMYIFPLVFFLYLRCFHPRKHGTKKNRFRTKPVSFAVQTRGKESAQRNSGEQVRTNYDPYASFFQYFTEAELGEGICIGLNMAIPLLNSDNYDKDRIWLFYNNWIYKISRPLNLNYNYTC